MKSMSKTKSRRYVDFMLWQGFIDELENELENVDFLNGEPSTLLAL